MKLIITSKEDLEDLVQTSLNDALGQFYKNRANQKKKSKNLTVKESAALLKVSEITIRNYIKKGLISAEKIGSRIIINREKLENTLKEVKSLKYKR
ncbi:DNA-binding protein [Dokdonia sinensis]|uniref:DNA-binding protein n=1 Tax=Dokdonia sinensis TaxID=2479847 RepID=A0A3M0G0J4_9FLAO|nr:helix-turn-helix domain-containing protein [Dokdonia sinensis]RMB58480.1 DNA-binding protein [Dokdonia sinensis]